MDLLLGTSILAASCLVFCWAFNAHRRPVRAKWVSWPGASMLICVLMTMMGPVGVGYLAKGALAPVDEFMSMGFIPLCITAALVAAAVIACPLLMRQARPTSMTEVPAANNRNRAPSSASQQVAA